MSFLFLERLKAKILHLATYPNINYIGQLYIVMDWEDITITSSKFAKQVGGVLGCSNTI